MVSLGNNLILINLLHLTILLYILKQTFLIRNLVVILDMIMEVKLAKDQFFLFWIFETSIDCLCLAVCFAEHAVGTAVIAARCACSFYHT